MVITDITVSYGVTVNLGNYENTKIEATVSGKREDGETTDEAFDMLFEVARTRVLEQAQVISPPYNSRFAPSGEPPF